MADWFLPFFYALLGALLLALFLHVSRQIQRWRTPQRVTPSVDSPPPLRQESGILHSHVIDQIPSRPEAPRAWLWDRLTEREMEITRLIEQGYRNADIARELSLSPHTVETHIKHIYSKLGVHGRIQLIKFLRDEGLL